MTRDEAWALTEDLIDAAREYEKSMSDRGRFADKWTSTAAKAMEATREKVIAALSPSTGD